MHHKVANLIRLMTIGIAVLGTAALVAPAAEAVAGEDGAKSELSAAQTDEARNIFMDWSCGACHALADGEGYGQIGPAFDGNEALDRELVVNRITNGQGAMPGFGGQLTDDEIALVSDYILQVKQ